MIEKLKSKSFVETYYFPNWIDAEKINPKTSSRHLYLSSDKFKILYSGNIGDKQDWEFFKNLAKTLFCIAKVCNMRNRKYKAKFKILLNLKISKIGHF